MTIRTPDQRLGLFIALARGVWHGRRWARSTLTSVMAVLTPLFA